MDSLRLEQLLATPLNQLPLTFVDVETTGLNPFYGDRICEVAAVRYLGGFEVDRFVSLVNPERRISPRAAAVNGITDESVSQAPHFGMIAQELLRVLAGGIPVAHNAPFDLAFLAHEISGAGLPIPKTPAIDTLAIARRCFSFPQNSLERISQRLGIAGGGHRALSDVVATQQVFERFLTMLEGGEGLTLGGLWAAQGGGVPWPNVLPRRSPQHWQLEVKARPDAQPADDARLHSPPSDRQQTKSQRMIGPLGSITDRTARPVQPSGANALIPEWVMAALEKGCRLRLSYRSAQGAVTSRMIDPVQLVSRDGTCYLVAFCHLRQEQRSFRLDRIVTWERC